MLPKQIKMQDLGLSNPLLILNIYGMYLIFYLTIVLVSHIQQLVKEIIQKGLRHMVYNFLLEVYPVLLKFILYDIIKELKYYLMTYLIT